MITIQVEDVKKFLADPDAYAAANPVAAAPAAGGAAEAKKEEKKAQICGLFFLHLLRYPPGNTFEDDFPFPKVGYVSSS